MTKDSPCVIADCPAWQRPCGCGFLSAGAPCGHPRMRERWRAAQASASGNPRPARDVVQNECAKLAHSFGERLARDVVQNEPANFADSFSLLRRAEAAQRPLSPARALQLALQLEVER